MSNTVLPENHLEDQSTAARHPEEMRATFAFRFGDRFAGKATARATPAGLVAAALLLSAVLLPALWLTRRRNPFQG